MEQKSKMYAFIQVQAEDALNLAKSNERVGSAISHMLAAFACELYLKIILGYSNKIKGHDLYKLFKDINEEDRNCIIDLYSKKKGDGYYALLGDILNLNIFTQFMNSSYFSIEQSLNDFILKAREYGFEEYKKVFKKLDARESFLILIERDKNMFIDSRYFYEKSTSYRTDEFIVEFAEILQEFVNNSKYRLLW
ncbi:MAG: hypothetical protein FWF56_03055 [Firmicutes bacterium]|nr:hypothetical protein [Bacillota bacterium]